MKMPKIPDWLKGDVVAGLITGIIAAITGAKIAEKEQEKKEQEKGKPTVGEALGAALNKMLALDRGEFLHELRFINSATSGSVEALLKLFDELESKKGLIKVADKWYREEWVTRKLLMIPPKYRASEYPWLSELLEQDRIQFFSKLEILNNDGWLQIMRQVKEELKDLTEEFGKKPTLKKFADRLDKKVGKLEKRAAKKGVRAWLDV